jgi:hypothetical protein
MMLIKKSFASDKWLWILFQISQLKMKSERARRHSTPEKRPNFCSAKFSPKELN